MWGWLVETHHIYDRTSEWSVRTGRIFSTWYIPSRIINVCLGTSQNGRSEDGFSPGSLSYAPSPPPNKEEVCNINNNGFIELTYENLRWFWSKYSQHHKLTHEGAGLLYKIMLSPNYDFTLQPQPIKRHILEMMKTSYHGKELIDKTINEQTGNMIVNVLKI